MLPFLNNKIGIQASSAEPIKREPDEPKEDTVLSDLELAHSLIDEDTEDDRLAKALIKSAIETLKGKQ